MNKSIAFPKRSLYVSAVCLLVALIVGGLLITPQGRVFAQQILGYFMPSQKTSHSVPAPVLTLQANPQNMDATLAPTPTSVSAQVCPQADPEQKYLCDLAFIQNDLGLWMKVLPFNFGGLEYREFTIHRLPTTDQAVLTINYGPAPYGALLLVQGRGDFPATLSQDGSDDHWGDVPAEAILSVEVNGQPGEYAEGAFVQMPGSDQYTWNAEVPMARLRWKEGEVWFQLLRPAVPEMFSNILGSREHLITLAESLVPSAELVQGGSSREP